MPEVKYRWLRPRMRMEATPELGKQAEWHNAALEQPDKPEQSILEMIEGWRLYAELHYMRSDALIGEDYVLGPAWEAIGDALRTLLNGDLGRLDGGTLDRYLLTKMRENGVNTEHK